MKPLIIYDSLYGNTKQVANVIAKACHGSLKFVRDVLPQDVDNADLLVIGTPTHGGRPSKDVQSFLRTLTYLMINKKAVAVFDTRLDANNQGIGLRTLMRMIGFAAPKVALYLEQRGAVVATPPTGFFVADKAGPLSLDELEKARAWGMKLATIHP